MDGRARSQVPTQTFGPPRWLETPSETVTRRRPPLLWAGRYAECGSVRYRRMRLASHGRYSTWELRRTQQLTVDEDRKETASARRRAIRTAVNAGFDPLNPGCFAMRFRGLLDEDPRVIITNADIDGLISSQLLSSVTGWQVGVIVDRFGQIRVAPDLPSIDDLVQQSRLFGVDIFSTLFPGISNHPVLFGARSRTHAKIRPDLQMFDNFVKTSIDRQGIINLSGWVGVGAMLGSDNPLDSPISIPWDPHRHSWHCWKWPG